MPQNLPRRGYVPSTMPRIDSKYGAGTLCPDSAEDRSQSTSEIRGGQFRPSIDHKILEVLEVIVQGANSLWEFFHSSFRRLVVSVANCDEPSFVCTIGRHIASQLGLQPVPELSVMNLLDLDEQFLARAAR